MTFRDAAGKTATFFERYVLSFVFFCLTWNELNNFIPMLRDHVPMTMPRFLGLARETILVLLGAFSTVFLFISRKPTAPPPNIRSVLVPLAATYLNLFYFLVNHLPQSLTKSLLSLPAAIGAASAGLFFLVIGPLIAFWGLVNLGRSFGVFVAVRKVVLSGPYRYVRHPMYLGWICIYIGYALANVAPATVGVILFHICLVIYRAKLEEQQLAAHSPEYREYMTRTGFLLPR